MHIDAGKIRRFEPEELQEESWLNGGRWVPLTPKEHDALIPLAPQLRLLHPLAALEGITADDHRKARNAAKRERRARRGKGE